MSSLRRIAATRANGRQSLGPLTPGGTQCSSQDALRPGLFSASILLLDESPDLFQAGHRRYFDRLRPADPVEAEIAQEMVAAVWRHRRAWRLEQPAREHSTPTKQRPTASIATSSACLNLLPMRSAGFPNEPTEEAAIPAQVPAEESLTPSAAEPENEPSLCPSECKNEPNPNSERSVPRAAVSSVRAKSVTMQQLTRNPRPHKISLRYT